MKTGQVNLDHLSGHFRGHFRGRLRGTFRGELSWGAFEGLTIGKINLVRAGVGALVGTLVGPLVGLLMGGQSRGRGSLSPAVRRPFTLSLDGQGVFHYPLCSYSLCALPSIELFSLNLAILKWSLLNK